MEEMELIIEELEAQAQEEADRADRAEAAVAARERELAEQAQRLEEAEVKLQQTIELAKEKVKGAPTLLPSC